MALLARISRFDLQSIAKRTSVGARHQRSAVARFCAVLTLSLFGFGTLAHGQTAPAQGPLRAGAARTDITDAALSKAKPGTAVNDRAYARAIVLDNGKTRAALVALDLGFMSTENWSKISQRMERELGIPADQLALMPSHTHAQLWDAGQYNDLIFQTIAQAAKQMVPATMQLGTGEAYVNVNRNMTDPVTGRWREGPNYDGPSDKTVSVSSFARQDGTPIAVMYNYAVHPVVTGLLDEVSADIPGAASRHIEASLGHDAVALFSYGASGDQNPIFFNQTYELRAIRIADYAKQGKDISNSLPPGGEGLDRNNPRVALLLDQTRAMSETMGLMLGEEVLRVHRSQLERPEDQIAIDGAVKSIRCPGRVRLDEGRAGSPGRYEDGDPVDLKLSMLRIGDLMLSGIDTEIFTMIAQRLKRESPYKHTIVSTITNGAAGAGLYIPHEAAFGYHTFEVLNSRMKPGCAEASIVNGFLDLIKEVDDTASN